MTALQAWQFCTTFQFYLGLKSVPNADQFIDQPPSDELMFKVLTAKRTSLPSELVTYLFYMLDDPSQDDDPILDDKSWKEIYSLLSLNQRLETNQDYVELLIKLIYDIYNCDAFRDHITEQLELETKSKAEYEA